MEIKTTKEIKDWGITTPSINWVAVDDLLEWIKKHDSKIEDATVYNHNGETYLGQTYHTISIKEITEELHKSHKNKEVLK